jgi:hypothetical protein
MNIKSAFHTDCTMKHEYIYNSEVQNNLQWGGDGEINVLSIN